MKAKSDISNGVKINILIFSRYSPKPKLLVFRKENYYNFLGDPPICPPKLGERRWKPEGRRRKGEGGSEGEEKKSKNRDKMRI